MNGDCGVVSPPSGKFSDYKDIAACAAGNSLYSVATFINALGIAPGRWFNFGITEFRLVSEASRTSLLRSHDGKAAVCGPFSVPCVLQVTRVGFDRCANHPHPPFSVPPGRFCPGLHRASTN
jgi:hypothetical protein